MTDMISRDLPGNDAFRSQDEARLRPAAHPAKRFPTIGRTRH
jgi:hypothetical protein